MLWKCCYVSTQCRINSHQIFFQFYIIYFFYFYHCITILDISGKNNLRLDNTKYCTIKMIHFIESIFAVNIPAYWKEKVPSLWSLFKYVLIISRDCFVSTMKLPLTNFEKMIDSATHRMRRIVLKLMFVGMSVEQVHKFLWFYYLIFVFMTILFITYSFWKDQTRLVAQGSNKAWWVF